NSPRIDRETCRVVSAPGVPTTPTSSRVIRVRNLNEKYKTRWYSTHERRVNESDKVLLRKGGTMKIGIIGAGQIGGTLTRRLAQVGHEVAVANSRGPSSLARLAKNTGAKAVTVGEAARAGEVVVVTIPEGRIRNLPKNLFEGVSSDVVVIDTGNY